VRWAIDFNARSEQEAAQFALPFAHVVENVKPERQRMKPDGTYVMRRPLPERYWQYADKRPAMRRAIQHLDNVIVIALTSRTVMPVSVPNGQVFTHALGVFALRELGDLAVLSSAMHQTWAIKYGSGMRNDPRYTPSDVFDTYPRPCSTSRLDEAGKKLDGVRRDVMLGRQLGLTALYNMVHDTEIKGDGDVDELRELHVEVDQATMAAYGWEDLSLGHGFHTYRQMERFTVSPAARVEILDRLLELNHERARAEGQDVPDQGELF
jgi:hypothetical protein